LEIPADAEIESVVAILGSGNAISAQDTVPFCVWCAAHHLDDYEEALWKTVSGLGDRDTTCAMVGGIVALSTKKVPQNWLTRREPFPDNFMV
jgi:ADP-ribosylglycohydrolase